MMLTTADHRRDSAGLRYVYPVVSRRAGGVSVGINLNVNNACNWACVYCQVANLRRGGPPPVDLALLERELAQFLDAAINGDFMARTVPPAARRLVDVAFSGNGEPTSAAEFAAAVDGVGRVLERFGLGGKLTPRLITNGSLIHRPRVAAGIRRLGELGGEVWFKLDRAQSEAMAEINGVPLMPAKVAANLARCAALASTWVQTCWFALDGQAPGAAARAAYCALLAPLAGQLAGIHLYGLARPSLQPAAARLTALPADELADFAGEVQKKTGIRVLVSP
ncbi:MAG: radical SAM protein [Desulfobulbus sp.]|nr:radical SAM protein [Desulfobulbus sp.]